MEQASQELEAKEYTATSGGGAVSVTLTGKMELTKIDISPDVVDAEDVGDAFRPYYCSYKRGFKSCP